jgi:hypothetical protein
MDPTSEFAINLVVSVIAGAGAGVLTATKIARLTIRAKDQHDARLQVSGALRRYRSTIEYREAQMPVTSSYPADYVDLPGQYALTVDVLQHAVGLSRGTQRRLREGLVALVGSKVVESSELLVDVPSTEIDAEAETKRKALEQLTALHHPEAGDQRAYLRRLLHEHTNPEARQLSLMTLDGMIRAVKA